MAVKLRLKRMGAKKRPFYRIVVADSRFPRDGRFIEEVGYYNPIEDPAIIEVNKDLALKWLNNGATPTDTVRDILSKKGILKEFHETKMSQKSKKESKTAKPKKAAVAKKTTKTDKVKKTEKAGK